MSKTKPRHVRRKEKRDLAGQRKAFRRRQDTVLPPTKKGRDREKSWVKRGEEGFRERDARLEAERREKEEAERRREEAERRKEEAERREEEARVLSEALVNETEYESDMYVAAWSAEEQTRLEAEEERIYLPVADINDDQLLAPPGAICKLFYDAPAVICRGSGSYSRAEKQSRTARSKQVFDAFSAIHHDQIAASYRRIEPQLLTIDHFKPIDSPFENLSFRRFLDSVATKAMARSQLLPNRPWKTLLIIRGINGFVTDMEKLCELNQRAKEKNIELWMCFYLARFTAFTVAYRLEEILNDPNPSIALTYLRRRFASLTRIRQPPPPNHTVEELAEWMKKYQSEEGERRNSINGWHYVARARLQRN
jgi:hypothetical protein